MISILSETKNNKILSGTVVVTVGSLLNSFFSYLLQLFLGRNLTLSEFGTYNALLSLFAMIGVISTVLSISTVKVVSEILSKKKFAAMTKLFWWVNFGVLGLGIFIFSLLVVFQDALSNYFNIPQPYLLVFLGLYFIGNLFLAVPNAFLRGLLRFKAQAVLSAAVGVLRLLMAALFIYLGYRVGGVYVGLTLAVIMVYGIGLWLLKKNMDNTKNQDVSNYLKRIATFSLPVLFMYLGMFSLNNLDLVLVKKFFAPEEAGIYAGTVIIGKIILFGAGAINVVMFPQISALKTAGEKYFDKFTLLSSLLLIALGSAIFIYNFFPILLARIFFGERFLSSAAYLPMFSIFVSLYVLINYLIMFFMALDKTKIALFTIPAVVLQFFLINLYHDSLTTIITINISVAFGLLVILLFYLYKLSKDTAR